MVSKANNLTTILGDEFDDDLRSKLMDVLRLIGATPIDSTRSLGGSQDLEELDVVVDGRSVRVEAETYVGLSISGPCDLVQRIHQMVINYRKP